MYGDGGSRAMYGDGGSRAMYGGDVGYCWGTTVDEGEETGGKVVTWRRCCFCHSGRDAGPSASANAPCPCERVCQSASEPDCLLQVDPNERERDRILWEGVQGRKRHTCHCRSYRQRRARQCGAERATTTKPEALGPRAGGEAEHGRDTAPRYGGSERKRGLGRKARRSRSRLPK